MAVKIRLKRLGEKKNPFYRIIVADSRSQEMVDLSMKSVLMIPNYDPCKLSIDAEVTKKWLSNGAQPTGGCWKAFQDGWYRKNKTSGGVIGYERISGNYR